MRDSKYVIGCDLAGPEGFDSIVIVNRKTGKVVHQDTQPTGSLELCLPWWLRLQMWLGGAVVMRETNEPSPKVVAALNQLVKHAWDAEPKER